MENKSRVTFSSSIRRIGNQIVAGVILTVSFSCTAQFSNRMQEEQKPIVNKEEFNIRKLQNLIDEGYKQIKPNVKKSVLVIGDTGTGKSTLINGLLPKKLEVTKKGMKYIIQLQAGQDGAKIGDTSISQTTIPYPWISEKGIVYWDCPGFEDTKGPVQDIANGFLIKKIFDTSQEVKILLLLSHTQFDSDRYKDILNSFKKISKLFKDFDCISEGIAIVVTKCDPDYKEKNYKEIFQEILAEQSDLENCTEEEKKIYAYFSQMGSLITCYKPKTIGQFSIEEDICQKIEKLPYIKSPSINIPISQSSLVHIYTLFDFAKSVIMEKNEELLQNFKNKIEGNEIIEFNSQGDSIPSFIVTLTDSSISTVLPAQYVENSTLNTIYSKMQIVDLKKEYESNFKNLYSLINYYDLICKILSTKNEVNIDELKNYRRFLEKYCDIGNFKYDLKQELEMIDFCKLILKELNNKISDFTHEIFEKMRPISQQAAKQQAIEIKEIYEELAIRFVDDTKSFLDKYANDKNILLNFADRLKKFSIAENIEIISDLNSLKDLLKSSTIDELIFLHSKIFELNESAAQVDLDIYIPSASQTIKNHLNERLNDINTLLEKIYIATNSIKTMEGHNTGIICGLDYEYELRNVTTGYYLSAYQGPRMSYPDYKGQATTCNFAKVKVNDCYNIIFGKGIYYLGVKKHEQNEINMELKRNWEPTFEVGAGVEAQWCFIKPEGHNSKYMIMSKHCGLLLVGNCWTQPSSSVVLQEYDKNDPKMLWNIE